MPSSEYGRDAQTDSSRTGEGVKRDWKYPVPPVDNSILGQARRDRAAGVQKGETRGAADSRAMGD